MDIRNPPTSNTFSMNGYLEKICLEYSNCRDVSYEVGVAPQVEPDPAVQA